MIYSVDVPGVSLYVERAGAGPALVLVSGGGGDAGMYEALVAVLAERFTVITFDRRGNSRSPVVEGPGPIDMAEQAADIVAILDHFGLDRAQVFGSSAGALITLELLIRYGDRLDCVVVHEPPLVGVLPDAAAHRAFFDEVGRIAATEGALQAFLAFAATTMDKPPRIFRSRLGRSLGASAIRLISAVGSAVRRIRRSEPDGMQRIFGNAQTLVRWEMPGLIHYEPDLEALRRTDVPWCFATGKASEGRYYSRPAQVLAEELDVPCVEFPGGHVAYQQSVEEFADRLTGTLEVKARG